MPLNEIITINTIAGFEKIINLDKAVLHKDTLAFTGTISERYSGLIQYGFENWLRMQFHTLFIVVAGSCQITLNEEPEEANADYLVIIPEGQPQLLHHLSSCEGYCLQFKTEFLLPVLAGNLSEQFPYFNRGAKHVFRLTTRESKLIQNCFKDIMRAYGHPSLEKESLMRDFIHILLLHIRAIYNTFSNAIPAAANRTAILATRFLHFAEQNFREVRAVQEYAKLLHISPKYLTKVVKETMGKTPQACINYLLLQEIRSLLKTTDKTVSEIAYHLNFSDQSHLNHFIKKHTGKTPLHLRTLG